MKKNLQLFILFNIFLTLFQQTILAQTAITNTNVVDVTGKQVLKNRTVLIADGKIVSVEAANKIKLPAETNIIDGTGKYVMPGLVDAHVHFFQSGGLYTRPDAIDLRKYKPYAKEATDNHNNMEHLLRGYTNAGITTVIDVGANVNFLKQRDTFTNKFYAPRVYMTGGLITTWEPPVFKNLGDDEPFHEMKTVEDARRFVQEQLTYKPDFIKIWYITPGNVDSSARALLPLVKTVVDEAHKHKLRVAVHATQRITAQLAVENGADFLVHGIDDEVVGKDFLNLLIKKKVVLCPTMVVAPHYIDVLSQQLKITPYDYAVGDVHAVGSLFDLQHINDTGIARIAKERAAIRGARVSRGDSLLLINTKKMIDAGVMIATGTDAGNPGTQHVSSYYEELDKMQRTGMNMWQLIAASTINGAKSLGMENEFGSVASGKTANLLVLNANPTENLANWRSIAIVVNKGNVIQHNTINKPTPEELAQRQLNAYNGRNLEAFLDVYADDVEIYDFPNTLTCKGKDAMRQRYQFLNTIPFIHCEITERIVQGNHVIDHERVQLPENKVKYATAIYEMGDDKIKKVWFIK